MGVDQAPLRCNTFSRRSPALRNIGLLHICNSSVGQNEHSADFVKKERSQPSIVRSSPFVSLIRVQGRSRKAGDERVSDGDETALRAGRACLEPQE